VVSTEVEDAHLNRRRRRAAPLRVFAWATAFYGAAATLMLASIALIGDRQVWTYLAALLFFWWLLPAPFLLLGALAARAWLAVALLVVPAGTCAYLEGPYVVHAIESSDHGAADVRVATYNMTNGARPDGLPALVAQYHPDVLLLQEVTFSRDELRQMVPEYPYASMGLGVSGPGHDGYAILSRYPVVGARAVTGLPTGARPTDLVTVDVHGHRVDLLPLHLASPCVDCPDPSLNPAGDMAHADTVRLAEAGRYAGLVRALVRQGRPVVVGGDLNSSALNTPLRDLTYAGLTDAQRAVGTTPGLTRGPGPGVARVDFVLVSGLDPVRVAVGSRGHSSHAPVIADLAWPAAAR
jgi:vancomycin resistance protein VanJ